MYALGMTNLKGEVKEKGSVGDGEKAREDEEREGA